MLDIYWLAGRATGYWAGYFLRTVRDLTGLVAARHLLAEDGVSSGFDRLRKENRLDLSMEALVLRPEFRPLFTPEELDKARLRLDQYGFKASRTSAPDDLLDEETISTELESLLTLVDAAPPGTRIEFRSAVVAFGPEARGAMRRWLVEERFPAFAIGVLEHLGKADRTAIAALEWYATTGGNDYALASAALDRLTRPTGAPTRRSVSEADTYRSTGVPEAATGGGCEVIVGDRECHNPGRHPIDGRIMCTTHRKAWGRGQIPRR